MFHSTFLLVVPLLASPHVTQGSTPMLEHSITPICAPAIADQARPGGCLQASSMPMLGLLFPISPELFVSSTDGAVGMGTTAPAARLHVVEPSTAAGPVGVRIDNASPGGIGLDVDISSPSNLGIPIGVRAYCESEVGISVLGTVGTTSYVLPGAGVAGVTSGLGNDSVGVYGLGADSTGNDAGVIGVTLGSGHASGVVGSHFASTGTGAGVHGHTSSVEDSANGVVGMVLPTNPGSSSAGVRGINYGTAGSGIGVWGSQDGSGYGVYGTAPAGRGVYGLTSSGSAGVVGESSGTALGVLSIGDSGVTGTKFFIQPHPLDAGKEIRFVCLEGNESGTYFRGSARTEEGRCRIRVPEDFRLVSEQASLTVQVTARGPGDLWVESSDLDEVVVRGTVDVDFDYFVNGVRRGFADVTTIRENTSFVPRERGVPFGAQYPEELRRILVENGILDEDFTPNEATAWRLGWELEEPRAQEPEPRRSPLAGLQMMRFEE